MIPSSLVGFPLDHGTAGWLGDLWTNPDVVRWPKVIVLSLMINKNHMGTFIICGNLVNVENVI